MKNIPSSCLFGCLFQSRLLNCLTWFFKSLLYNLVSFQIHVTDNFPAFQTFDHHQKRTSEREGIYFSRTESLQLIVQLGLQFLVHSFELFDKRSVIFQLLTSDFLVNQISKHFRLHWNIHIRTSLTSSFSHGSTHCCIFSQLFFIYITYDIIFWNPKTSSTILETLNILNSYSSPFFI